MDELYSEFFMFEQCNFLPSGGMANPATWKPINDAKFSRDPFFTGGDPKSAMKSGKVANVPVMVGFTKDEGLINTARLFKDPERAGRRFNRQFDLRQIFELDILTISAFQESFEGKF